MLSMRVYSLFRFVLINIKLRHRGKPIARNGVALPHRVRDLTGFGVSTQGIFLKTKRRSYAQFDAYKITKKTNIMET